MSGPGDPRDGERRLDDLGRRLEDFERRAEASGTVRRKAEPAGAGSGLGTALKLSTELVAAVVVGGVMGWLLDRWLGTSPGFLLAFLALGIAAGFLNVFRAAKLIQERAAKDAAKAPAAPGREDEED